MRNPKKLHFWAKLYQEGKSNQKQTEQNASPKKRDQ